MVFRDTRNAKKYFRWLRRHQRARRAGPAGMAKLRNAFPGVKTDLWLISPYAREKVTPKEARGFWKNCEDIVKYSRYRRVKRLAKEKAQAGIGKFSGSLAGLGDWLKGQSGKL